MAQLAQLQPGWLLLLCALVVLAVGLLLLLSRQPASTPVTAAAPVALTAPVTLTPLPLLWPTPSLAAPLPPLVASGASPGTRLRIEPPVCYDAPQQSVLCLGRVYNAGSLPVHQVRLLGQHPLSRESLPFMPEQRYILPGDFAPYQLRLPDLNEQIPVLPPALAAVEVYRARPYDLTISDEQGVLLREPGSYGRYVVTATLTNPHPRPLTGVQVVCSLTDRRGHLSGYRVSLEQGLQPGETLRLHLELIPRRLDDTFSHRLSVLAWDN
ncbi:MAG: hypothetical protein MUE40_14450 [Anaerolineae bacterium]|jgi:hypothetical protein|nr:hypothetical protein [Anaerolineae bacterium]